MNVLEQLEAAPKNLILYALGLIGAIVDDYTLVTLTIFCVLLGFVLSAILIPIAVFFGGYFIVRLERNIAEGIATHANATHAAGMAQAQSTMQVASALAQPRPSQGVSDVDILP